MPMNFLIWSFLLTSVPSAYSASLSFEKSVNLASLTEELKEKTGLIFFRACPEAACIVNGHIQATPGRVEIVVYETESLPQPWMKPVRLDGALKARIADVVKEHKSTQLPGSASSAEAEAMALLRKLEAKTISADEKDRLLSLLVRRVWGR